MEGTPVTWTLPEPMLTTSVASPDLPPGCAAEPKLDGYRAQLARWTGGRALLRSRQGTDMTAAFPEIREAALAQLPDDTGFDGELVVWAGRLAFEWLQQRLARRRGAAALAAAQVLPGPLRRLRRAAPARCGPHRLALYLAPRCPRGTVRRGGTVRAAHAVPVDHRTPPASG